MVRTVQISLSSKGNGETLDITDKVTKAVTDSGASEGTVTVFVPGSTAAVTTIEYESGAIRDLGDAIERMSPIGIEYAHNARWGDGNGHSHVRAALLGASLSIPFSNKKLLLGTWQQVVLVDFDNRPRDRRLIFQVMGE